MKQLLRLLFLGCIPLLLTACDYSASGSYFEEVNPIPEVIADITLDPKQDTLRLRGDVNLRFQVHLPGRIFYGYRLDLGDKLLASGNSFDGTHVLYTRNYNNGMHRLRLFVVANSGTGSLADKSGAEVVELYKDWVVYIDNTPPRPVAFTHIGPEDGRLKLEWQPYTGTGFVKYDIIRNLGSYYESVCATITDPNQTTWTDHDYVGGQASYTLATHVNGYNYPARSSPVAIHYPLPHVLSSTYNAANELIVTISSTAFYNNHGRYELHVNLENVSTTAWKDTVMTLQNPSFGEDIEAIVYTYSKSAVPIPSVGTYNPIPAYGTPWGPHEVASLFARPSNGLFYSATRDHLKVIDAATLQVKQERNIAYKQHYNHDGNHNVVSADGRYMYVVLDNTIHRLDPLTLQTLATYEFDDLLPEDSYYSGTLEGCSKNNRLLVRARSSSTFAEHVYVVDMEQRRVLLQKNTFFYHDVASISPEGKTVRVASEVFQEASSGNWQKLDILPHEVSTLKFHPTRPLFFTTYGSVHFYSTTNGTKQKSVHTAVELYDSEIEAGSGYLYGVQEYTLYVYNIDTGQLIRKLQLGYTAEAFVYKNRIYSKDRHIPL